MPSVTSLPPVLPKNFYLRPTLRVARELVGKTLVHETARGVVGGRIVETEAYLGAKDAAAHSFRGPTARTAAMFLEGGISYVYFTYGFHHCMNVVTEKKGTGHAVLIRALEPIWGIEVMQRYRQQSELQALCSGPGKLCEALGITLKDNALDLTRSKLTIRNGAPVKRIKRLPRIGITKNAQALWRFVDAESPYLSRKL